MAAIPSLNEAKAMVRKALAERAPEAMARLQDEGALPEFVELHARAMVERMEELDDPTPELKRDGPLLQRAQRIREVRDRAVEQVLADMLSTETLEAETTSPRSAA